MNDFGHSLNRSFKVSERMQFVTDASLARRVREESKKMKISRGELIERVMRKYIETLDAEISNELDIKRRNEMFSKFENDK